MKLQITDRHKLLAGAEQEALQRRFAFQLSRFEQLIRSVKAELGSAGEGRTACELTLLAQGFKPIRVTEVEEDPSKSVARALDRAQRTLQRSLDMRQLFSATAEIESGNVQRRTTVTTENNPSPKMNAREAHSRKANR